MPPITIQKLQREMLETNSGYDPVQLAYRNGHNDRGRSLIAYLEQGDVEAGLAALVVATVDEADPHFCCYEPCRAGCTQGAHPLGGEG